MIQRLTADNMREVFDRILALDSDALAAVAIEFDHALDECCNGGTFGGVFGLDDELDPRRVQEQQ